jgi:hypothetical protein
MNDLQSYRATAALLLALTACGTTDPDASEPGRGETAAAIATQAVARQIKVTFAGDGPGTVYVTEGIFQNTIVKICTSSCTIDVAADDDNAIALWGFTPQTFAGWTGGPCAPPAEVSECAVPDTSEFSVTATFNRDPGDFATVFPARPVAGLVFAPDGDLIVADAAGVSKLLVCSRCRATARCCGAARSPSRTTGFVSSSSRSRARSWHRRTAR